MFRKFALSVLVLATAFLATAAIAGGGVDHRVRAELFDTSHASGKAEYRERMNNGRLEQRFKISIEDAEPGAMLDVFLNGELVGIIVVSPLGQGELDYRTDPEPGESDPLPSGFPTVLAGDDVSVGSLAGIFEND